MKKILLVSFCLFLMTGSCTQQKADEVVPPGVTIGEEYYFGFFTGEQRLTVLEITSGWVKVRDRQDLIFWVNRDAINTVREASSK